MKTIIHKANTRGYADHGWLKSYHSFSFANYYNPQRVRFGLLRVLNDDIIKPSEGFGTHPHDNMEIISIPIYGKLAHKDSTGNEKIITKDEVQVMSAGTGIYHSEYNASDNEDANFLQLWIFPKLKNITPRYEQKKFDLTERKNKLQLIVSPEKNNGSLRINQDAYLWLGNFEKGKNIKYSLKLNDNGVYIFLINGNAEIEGTILENRDAIGIEETENVNINFLENTELLIIEVPMKT
jgi:redox-sensitive bicupin YhaK (pirin superfamily)